MSESESQIYAMHFIHKIVFTHANTEKEVLFTYILKSTELVVFIISYYYYYSKAYSPHTHILIY